MHIAIITGGTSAERKVALRSADNLADWITRAGHTHEIFDFGADLRRFLERYSAARMAKAPPTARMQQHSESHPDFDLVIPMLHGVYGEDGQITAFVRTLGYQCAFSDFAVHALAIDKHATNLFLGEKNIAIPQSIFLREGELLPENMLPFPLIVKPNRGGSSFATARVETFEELHNACKEIRDDDILVQQCIEGREFTVGVYRDKNGYSSLPIIEIITKNTFFDYEEKYESDGSNEIFLEGEQDLQEKLSQLSIRIAEYLQTKGVVRIDWRYDGEEIFFLEVNTIPGFTSASLVPKMWRRAGKSEVEFIEMLFC